MSTGSARAWLEIMRISNLPTVVSNAIAGAAVGAAAGWGIDGIQNGIKDWHEMPEHLLWSIAAPPLAYVAGMILNDAFDARIDARERPSRPIPSGRIRRFDAFAVGFALLALSVIASRLSGSALALSLTLALVGGVVLYNAVHARSAASVLLLACCRALAALIPLAAFHGQPMRWTLVTIALPAALALWTVALSLLARGEADGQRGPRVAAGAVDLAVAGFFTCVAGVAILAGYLLTRTPPSLVLTGAVAALALISSIVARRAWQRMRVDPRETPRSIGRFIACIALIDAIFIIALGDPLTGVACIALAALATRLQRRIAGS